MSRPLLLLVVLVCALSAAAAVAVTAAVGYFGGLWGRTVEVETEPPVLLLTASLPDEISGVIASVDYEATRPDIDGCTMFTASTMGDVALRTSRTDTVRAAPNQRTVTMRVPMRLRTKERCAFKSTYIFWFIPSNYPDGETRGYTFVRTVDVPPGSASEALTGEAVGFEERSTPPVVDTLAISCRPAIPMNPDYPYPEPRYCGLARETVGEIHTLTPRDRSGALVAGDSLVQARLHLRVRYSPVPLD